MYRKLAVTVQSIRKFIDALFYLSEYENGKTKMVKRYKLLLTYGNVYYIIDTIFSNTWYLCAAYRYADVRFDLWDMQVISVNQDQWQGYRLLAE